MKKVEKILYWLKNIAFFFFLFGSIKLLPNIDEIGIIGTIFLIFIIIYSIFNIGCFLKKDDNLNKDVIQNIISIFLYLYVYLIAMKYLQIEKEFLIINNIYFYINYIIASVSMIGLITNTCLIFSINKKEKRND